MVGDDSFLDDIDDGEIENERTIDIEANELAEKEAQVQAQKNQRKNGRRLRLIASPSSA